MKYTFTEWVVSYVLASPALAKVQSGSGWIITRWEICMWTKAGDGYRSQTDPPYIGRIKAMLKQCRERGGDGCNCDNECKVNKILEREVSDDSDRR